MEISGKIIEVGQLKTGTSKSSGEEWSVQEYVIEDTSDTYTKHMVFEVFGSDRIKQFAIQKGDELKVFFDIDARQWKDRWFNSIRAWKVEKTATAPAASAPAQQAQPFDALPF